MTTRITAPVMMPDMQRHTRECCRTRKPTQHHGRRCQPVAPHSTSCSTCATRQTLQAKKESCGHAWCQATAGLLRRAVTTARSAAGWQTPCPGSLDSAVECDATPTPTPTPTVPGQTVSVVPATPNQRPCRHTAATCYCLPTGAWQLETPQQAWGKVQQHETNTHTTHSPCVNTRSSSVGSSRHC